MSDTDVRLQRKQEFSLEDSRNSIPYLSNFTLGFPKGSPFGRARKGGGLGEEKLRIEKVWFSSPKNYTASNACFTSSRMSSMFSKPVLKRIIPPSIPAATSCSSVS